MDEKKREMLNEILGEVNENDREFIKAALEMRTALQNGPDSMTIIDWNDGPEVFLKNGISVTEIFSRKVWNLDVQSNCVVRNFPSLEVNNAHLTNCVFENCGDITIEQGTAVGCTFSKVNTIYFEHAKVYDSLFQNLRCDSGGLIISMEDSEISGSKFKNIYLEDDNYLADGVGDCLIEKCTFYAVETERKDGELFTCQKTVGSLFKNTVEYDMVDRHSCRFLKNFLA